MQTDESTLDWKAAHRHVLEIMGHYLDLLDEPQVNVQFALSITFFPLLVRYINGERTQTLYEEMMEVR
jgi:hypothetical protein